MLLGATLVLAFALQALFGATSGPALAQMGATTPWFWEEGQFWSLFSASLLHIGLLHLLANLYFVWMIGRALEVGIGGSRMLLVFFGGAITGNVLSVGLNPGVLSAGASGGGWGLMVAVLVLLVFEPLRRGTRIRGGPLGPVLRLVGLNALISFIPGVNALAHFGGGLGGALAVVVTRYLRVPWAPVAGLAWGTHVLALAFAIGIGHPWSLFGPLEPVELLDGRVEVLSPGIPFDDDGDQVATSREPARYGVIGQVTWVGEALDPDAAYAEIEQMVESQALPVPCPGACRAGRVQLDSMEHWFSVRSDAHATVATHWTVRDDLPKDWVAEAVTGTRLLEPADGTGAPTSQPPL